VKWRSSRRACWPAAAPCHDARRRDNVPSLAITAIFSKVDLCVSLESIPHILPDILTLFSIASSLAASHILAVSSVKTTPVRRSSVSGVKCSGTNFPSEISVPFETKSQSLLTERASCSCRAVPVERRRCAHTSCRWGLESTHTALQMPCGTAGGSSA
jgi:hypothetical protein